MRGRARSDRPEEVAPRARASWWPAVRMVASAVMLGLLLPRMHLPSLLPPGHHGDTVVYLMLGVLTTLAGIVLSAWRWQRTKCPGAAASSFGRMSRQRDSAMTQRLA